MTIARPLTQFDFAMLELGILSNMSEPVDVHTELAKKLYKTDMPTEEQRRFAKNVNFRMMYTPIGAF